MIRRLWHAWASVVLLLALPACGAIPVGYDRIEDSELYIAPDTLRTIETGRLQREEIVAILGPAEAENPQYRALGFRRCAEWSGKELQILFPLVMPFSGEEYENRHCQMVGIWFDETGRAFRAASKSYVEGTLSCSLDYWLHKPGGSCW